MKPAVIAIALEPAITAAAKILSQRAKKQLAQKAISISETEPESENQVRLLFDETKKRLGFTWKIGISMTITLFVLFVGMAVTAVVSGLVFDKPMWSIVSGGISTASLLSVIVWKPFERTFQATATTQRLETIAVGLEQEWAACSAIEDPEARLSRIREANQAALGEIAKISIS